MNDKKAGEILYGFLDKTYKKIGKTYSEMFRSWDNIAGDKLKDHSRIKEFMKGSVIVEVDHPAYFQLIQMENKRILSKLKKLYPELEISKLKIIISDTKQKERYVPGEKKNKAAEKIEKSEFNKLMSKLKNAINSNTEKN